LAVTESYEENPQVQGAEAGAMPQAPGTTVTVSGQGRAVGTPDLAHASVSVQTAGDTAAEAARKNAEIMTAVLQELWAAGLAAGDVQTSGLHVRPIHMPIGPPSPKLSADALAAPLGYVASNTVTVTVQDLGRLGALLDAVVGAGATEIGGVQFSVRDHVALEHEALSHALAAARAKAEMLATQLGMRVAGVISVQEGWSGHDESRQLRAVIAETPIETPEYGVSAQVQAVFRLGPG
jgi:uncharacterized protein YggE